jgi:FtsZ-interacting cell division protein ZipA
MTIVHTHLEVNSMDLPTTSASHFPTLALLLLIAGFIAAAAIGTVAWFRSQRPVGWRSEQRNGHMPASELEDDGYDRAIIPAETAARQEREKEAFKESPDPEEERIKTTSGYTVDREGLANNYAVEPEMYVNEPGDLREERKERREEKAETRQEINETDEEGKLTMAGDERGKGPGLI